jgi:hypothetical protein
MQRLQNLNNDYSTQLQLCAVQQWGYSSARRDGCQAHFCAPHKKIQPPELLKQAGTTRRSTGQLRTSRYLMAAKCGAAAGGSRAG